MAAPDPPPLDELTEKEKATLRLIVRGHDAKSAASELDLSVHTINERLRSARRKLDVTSSREAARLLLESEEGEAKADTTPGLTPTPGPKKPVYEGLGDAGPPSPGDDLPIDAFRSDGALWTGGIIMIALAALIFVLATGSVAPTAAPDAAGDPAPQTQAPQNPAPMDGSDAVEEVLLDGLEDTARDWLALVDAQDWDRSHAAAAPALRQFIASEDFGAMVGRSRNPLGAVVERRLDTFGSVKTGEASYRLVTFDTDFQDRRKVSETVTLVADGGIYKVSGYWIGEGAQAVGNGTPITAAREGDSAARR